MEKKSDLARYHERLLQRTKKRDNTGSRCGTLAVELRLVMTEGKSRSQLLIIVPFYFIRSWQMPPSNTVKSCCHIRRFLQILMQLMASCRACPRR